MKIEVNENLKKSILNSIPSTYSNLEKALFIYNQLCLKLNYSMDFFLDEEKYAERFCSLDYIKTVDGEKQTNVVCFTFNAIYLSLLIEANICTEEAYITNRFYSYLNNSLKREHDALYLSIDNIDLYIDATVGVLDKNDLILLKYSTSKIQGWQLYHSNNYKAENQTVLNNAIDKVQNDIHNLKQLEEKYYKFKVQDETYKTLPVEERIEMFRESIKDIPPYSIASFNYMLKLKKKLFSKLEAGREEFGKYHVDLIFAKDNRTKEYKALFFSNKLGYDRVNNKENFDTLEIDLISVKNNTSEKITIEQLEKFIHDGILTTSKDEKISIYKFNMIQKGMEKE